MNKSIYDFQINEINGTNIDFKEFKNKTLLIVNTASKCGLAPQLKELQFLYDKYHDQGLEIIGFPSDQFKQELTSGKIDEYCQIHYGVNFLMTEKIKVNGKDTHPIFKYLKEAAGHGIIKWNFTKFLIKPNETEILRYSPIIKPLSIENEIINSINHQNKKAE